MGDSAGVQEVLEKHGKHPTWLGGALLEHPATEPVRARSFIRVYSVQLPDTLQWWGWRGELKVIGVQVVGVL